MPSKSGPQTRSRSPGRSQRKSKSRSRSRSRSRGRSKSPARKSRRSQSPSRKSRRSQSPTRKPAQSPQTSRRSSERKSSPVRKRPETPRRQSARLAEKSTKDEDQKDVGGRKTAFEEIKSSMAKDKASKLYEFGGPIGTTLLMFGLPAALLICTLSASQNNWKFAALPKFPRNLDAYFNSTALCLYLGWIIFQGLLALLPVGRVVDGQPTRNGKRLKYKCNGFFALVVSVAAFSVLAYLRNPVTIVLQNLTQLMCTGLLFSLLLSIYLFFRSTKSGQLSQAGNSGCAFYDFYMGHELSPRFGDFDLKFFFELRPGLIGWVMINMALLYEAYSKQGMVPAPFLIVAAFQIFFVSDCLWFESAVLTTTDITREGYGFMLAFNQLAWVPFMYSLQTRYLLQHPQSWSPWALGAIVLLQLVGYIIYRGSNSQKDRYRKNPHDPALAHLETLPSSAGKRMLVCGWWGLCRHPNYLGDIIMALSWSLPCGFSDCLPYFYPLYLTILLIHRAHRDGERCRRKHGSTWDRYCQRVKYRIFPYVY